ncbi:MAG: FKBP-type peptidyl-prolyl cis-trans isomerase [Parabacteroides sp.]|jgi:FKBP-type peptidyl-prolyl cis-trans isomerase|uniref:Peptidyl-prolyl cis-trans isomerase n=1 Tax=Parabacteroides faecalis TaxID=2924040 RepID=A0ABT0C3J8_9BACT|nr:FKBP-type peptidyl-prolyl cis-trans isomerase [Parabacteroides faecalis]MBS7342837.1 FKBP-type peptidyl-prolyl cis-trans isomerase [Parabacteroides sp.]MDY5621755.1 FKBP-type peptidyl-prolyl cis-trans isomerase [Bacteroidales bacterium]MCI7287691.1 FKBP-type peptidyl-prolyl cis-trans isomerase [Parabacteroides sp.]MCI7356199.1 FKBP-type peptidyl-prolyl cis-trans isomerase [Parabacteroides sp.]MCI7707739.1 FKBP-type peptidyl-prolyl cis-trans isomerase [Parabacteroides sp.]
MKKYWHITWMLVVMLFTLAACSDDDENEIVIDEAWKEINLAAFDARLQDAKTDTSLFTINSESGNGQIICKILKKGEGTETIYYTSKVNCYYKGCFVTNEDGEVVADRDSVLTQGEVFDSRLRENGDDKVLFEVDDSGLRDGFATALQHMHEGDIWEVWMPYQLGYGVSGYDDIKPYTTLVFQIEVTDIVEQ